MVMPEFKVGDIITFKYMIDKPENTPILIVKKISDSNHYDYIVHAYVTFHTIKSYIGQDIYMCISGDSDLVLHPYVFPSLSMPSIPETKEKLL